MVKKYLLALVLIYFNLTTFSQTNTDFWFAAPEVTSGHGDQPMFLRLTSFSQSANVTISEPANTEANFPVISNLIPANSTWAVDLTSLKDQIECKPPDMPLNLGLHIHSDVPITVYYEISHPSNPEIFTLKGNNALGTSFYIPSQSVMDNHAPLTPSAYTSFDIIATEDQTTVSITPKKEIVGHAAGLLFTVSLNKGQVYSAQASGQLGLDHLMGSTVTSDKPVAITVKDDSDEYPGQGCYDLTGDQIVPVTIIGMSYIVVRGYTNNTVNDWVFVTATANNTNVSVNGILMTTINAGDSYDFNMTASNLCSYVQTDHPVYVWHLTGYGCEAGSALLPAMDCTGSTQVAFTRTRPYSFELIILTKAGAEFSFTMDSDPTIITGSMFSPVPGVAGFVYARVDLDVNVLGVGPHVLANSQDIFHMGVIHTYNAGKSGCSYGYFTDFASLNLGPDLTVCTGSPVTFNAGPNRSSYAWYYNGNPYLSGVQTITVNTPGTWSVTVDDHGCILSDDIQLTNYPFVSPSISGLTSFCAGSSQQLSVQDNFSSYLWSTGATTQTISVTTAGPYSVTVSDNNGCQGNASVDVVVHPLPLVTLEQPTPACVNMVPYLLTGGSPPGGMYTGTGMNPVTGFFDPSSGVGPHNITYTWVDGFGCTNSDSKTLIVNVSPQVTFDALAPVCVSATPVSLSGGLPAGGTYSGTGVDPVAGTFTPAVAPNGSQITYTLINSDGCSGDAQQFQQVTPLPAALGSIIGNNSVCQADQGSNYTLQNPDPLATAFHWTVLPVNAGNTAGTGQSCIVNWSNGYTGSAQLLFTASGLCGSSGFSLPFNILVKPSPAVVLLVCNDLKTTKNGKPIALKGGQPLGTAGSYEGIGVSESPAGSGKYVFDPSNNQVIAIANGTPYPVTFHYTNSLGCSASASEEIKVYPSNAGVTCQTAVLTDIRDGQSYPTFRVGSGVTAKCWMARNLNYGKNVGELVIQTDNCVAEKYCAGNVSGECDHSGGAYQWDELMLYDASEGAQGLCPPEWHVPTKAEWEQLIDEYKGDGQAGSFLKESGSGSGFNGLTSGIYYFGQYWSFNVAAVTGSMFWTSHAVTTGSSQANGLNSLTPSVSGYIASKANAFSVRCVKD